MEFQTRRRGVDRIAHVALTHGGQLLAQKHVAAGQCHRLATHCLPAPLNTWFMKFASIQFSSELAAHISDHKGLLTR